MHNFCRLQLQYVSYVKVYSHSIKKKKKEKEDIARKHDRRPTDYVNHIHT